MKIHLDTSLLLATLLLLPACSSTPKTAYDTPAVKGGTVVQNDLYVATVERMARQSGTQVVWVNPPKKRVPQTVAASN